MTDQELRKLKRPELLEIMLRQGRALTDLRAQHEAVLQKQGETEAALAEARETLDRLKKKLDQKDLEMQEHNDEMDATFERLKRRLDAKDVEIGELREQLEREQSLQMIRLTEPGSIAEQALRLIHIFEDAQRAAEQYIEAVRSLAKKKELE